MGPEWHQKKHSPGDWVGREREEMVFWNKEGEVKSPSLSSSTAYSSTAIYFTINYRTPERTED